MSYTNVNVDAFEGLNSAVAPELIKDGEARDILNFRMEKVGKLVSRNGYIFGAWTNPKTLATHDTIDPYTTNLGIIGIGELILEEKWEAIDTDRLMVYVVRSMPAMPADSENLRHFSTYLFVPLSGQFVDEILSASLVFDDADADTKALYHKRDATPQGSNEETVNLFAPNRDIPDMDQQSQMFGDPPSTYNQNKTKTCPWIKQYIDINQYRNRLVISDMINGDMLLEDEFGRREADTCEKADHKLHLRPNCLTVFDIDVVEIDPRFGQGQENDKEEGVETGMALYNYVMPKATTKNTINDYDYKLANPEWNLDGTYLGEESSKRGPERQQKILQYINSTKKTMMSAVQLLYSPKTYLPYQPSIAFYNSHNYKRFTTTNNQEEYDDVLGRPELKEEKFIDNSKEEIGDVNEDGVIIKQRAADVYIWEDTKIKYHPTVGKENPNSIYPYLMRDIDREFQKLTPGIPRVTKLKPKTNMGKYAPLGVWKYKFVWDFGDEIHSAPSTEIVVPDIMWSACTDEELTDNNQYLGRPFMQAEAPRLQDNGLRGIEPTTGHLSLSGVPGKILRVPFEYLWGTTKLRSMKPPFYVNEDVSGKSIQLTTFGEKFVNLKRAVYGNISNKYGYNEIPNKDINEILKYTDNLYRTLLVGALSTQVTCFFSESDIQLQGIAWEHFMESQHKIRSKLFTWQDAVDGLINSRQYNPNEDGDYTMGSIIVPIFQTPGAPRTYCSVFDDEGRYRLAYVGNYAKYGKTPFFFVPPWHYWSLLWLVPDGREGQLYFGIWARDDRNGRSVDLINAPIEFDETVGSSPTYMNYLGRDHTMLRAVREATSNDRLTVTNNDLPNEVKNRLIKSGQIELHLLQRGDNAAVWDDSQIGEDDTFYIGVRDPWWDNHIKQGDESINTDMKAIREHNLWPDHQRPVAIKRYMFVNGLVWLAIDRAMVNYQNIDIYIYGEAERFLGVEQLTSYFPSSLLYGAPRLALKIPKENVPKKAKRLLIYRTRATHSNEYNPLEYGLVDAVDVSRNENTGEPEFELKTGELYEGFYYFDKVKDNQIDFAETPDFYEGLRRPLKSRFNIPLNERVYYFNFEEGYRPEAPRKFEDLHYAPEKHDYDNEPYIPTAAGFVTDSNTADEGFMRQVNVKYRYAFEDIRGQISEYKEVLTTESIYIARTQKSGFGQVVVLFGLPDAYDASIQQLSIYRAESADNDFSNAKYRYIGKIEPGDEGIFVDTDLELGAIMSCSDVDWETYEGGLRWSEPYRPDWIKGDSFMEIKAGDGKQGTGIESQYGNLVIFKETSMHRLAVQAVNPPVSRVDEITPELGNIAPNSLINVNNKLYFLTWKGWYSYDNNVLTAIDNKFFEELNFVMQNNTERNIRDVSAGYNPAYNEIYLNVPKLPTPEYALGGRETEWGQHEWYGYDRTLLGHIYVMNMTSGYNTKFAYQTTVVEKTAYGKETVSPLQHIRLYFTNSLGQLRTGDILPSRYGSTLDYYGPLSDKDGIIWAGIYVETPYNTIFKDYPYYPEYEIDWQSQPLFVTIKQMNRLYIDEDVYLAKPPRFGLDINMRANVTHPIFGYFPKPNFAPIKSAYKSKFFTGNDETLIKRVRKARMNLFSKGLINVAGIVLPHDTADDRIENIWLAQPLALQNKFFYEPTTDYYDVQQNMRHRGTNRNILSFVPVVITTQPIVGKMIYNDLEGKPIRFSIEIEAQKRTQINEIGFNWRPMHGYLA